MTGTAHDGDEMVPEMVGCPSDAAHCTVWSILDTLRRRETRCSRGRILGRKRNRRERQRRGPGVGALSFRMHASKDKSTEEEASMSEELLFPSNIIVAIYESA